jgi:TfuA protein
VKPVVFLGPSLPWAEAREVLDADFRPPVKRGDLPRLSKDVRYVGIIDGVFLGDSSVGHREILALLRSGVKVVGGSSMGALRAAELHELGMQGVGVVFNMYANHSIEGDDEVALVFNPETLEALSEPLVNIRVNLEEAVRRSLVSAKSRDNLLKEMADLYFPRRSIPVLLDYARSSLLSEEVGKLQGFLANGYVDVKKRDAIEVLWTLKEALKAGCPQQGVR